MRLLVSFVACLLAFFTLSVIAYCIPNSAMESNLRASATQLSKEGLGHQEIEGGKTWAIDNFTVGIMLNEAAHGSSNPIRYAMLNPKAMENDPIVEFVNGIGVSDDMLNSTYAQYWHGYLIFLKPLLLFLDLAQIRKLSLVVFSALLYLVGALLVKRDGVGGGLAIVTAFVAFNCTVMIHSLSLSACPYLALVGMLFVLISTRNHKHMLPDLQLWWPIPFFLLGGLTAYFDFLCTPVVTLGMPLSLLVYLSRDSINRTNVSRCLLSVVVLCLCWALGYAMLFVAKWIVAMLITGENVIATGLRKVAQRSSERASEGDVVGSIDRFQAIWRNQDLAFPRWGVIAGTLIGGGTISVATYLFTKYHKKPDLWWAIPVVLVASLPYAWYYLAANHSYQHVVFTYRSLSLTALCLGLLASGVLHDAIQGVSSIAAKNAHHLKTTHQ